MTARGVVPMLLLAVLFAGCRDSSTPRQVEMKTLGSAETRLRTVRRPPSLDRSSQPEGTTRGAPEEPHALPFAPAVAMDPVDGSKVVISPTTPTVSYRERFYYFSSDETKKAFLADPSRYARAR